jgi:hypothetical protein
MPIVTSPLFSISCEGSIGKLITYKKGMRGTVCRKYAKPTGLPTALQTDVRTFTGERMKHWPSISPADQSSWFLLALDQNVEPINAYLKFNWERRLQGLATTDVYPPLPPGLVADIIVTAGIVPPVPDLTGNYFKTGTYDGYDLYTRGDPPNSWLWNFAGWWVISPLPPDPDMELLFGSESDLISTYDSIYPYLGFLVTSLP